MYSPEYTNFNKMSKMNCKTDIRQHPSQHMCDLCKKWCYKMGHMGLYVYFCVECNK